MPLTTQGGVVENMGQAGAHLFGMEGRTQLDVLERGAHVPEQPLKHWKNGLPLKGLCFSEAYLKSNLIVVLRIRAKLGSEREYWCAIGNEGDSGDSPSACRADFVDAGLLLRGQQDHVLVGNVQFVKVGEILTLPAHPRLYVVGQEFDDVNPGAIPVFFMSFHHGLTALPRVLAVGINNGEKRALTDGVAVGLDQLAVCVVEGGTEVVKRVSEDSWRVLGESSPQGDCPGLTIVLGSDSMFVVRNVHFENAFELVDVMFGPFGL